MTSESRATTELTQRLSRRTLLVRGAILGASLPIVGSLLAACGDDDSDDDSEPAAQADDDSDGSDEPEDEEPTEEDEGDEGEADEGEDEEDPDPDSEPAQAGGRLVYAVTREPDRLDPTRSSVAPAQMSMFSLYDCLVSRDDENVYHPWLAETWEISDDGQEYTFELRNDVTFHDGTEFNSSSVQYMMDRVHDPDAETRISPAAYGFYEATDTPDDFTAVIQLNEPWAPLLDSLSYIYRVVSPTAGEEYGDDLAQNPVGSGPFMFDEWVTNSHVRLVRNPDYNWASPMFGHQGPAHLDEVEFRQVPEDSTRVAALEGGEVHIVEMMPPQDIERISGDPNFEVLVGLVPGRSYQFTINVRKPPTDELAVRQAMNYALDQDSVVQIAWGPYQPLDARLPAYSVLVPRTWGFEERSAELYPYDPDQASQLLEDAGWQMGDNGIRERDGEPLQIILATWGEGVEEIVQAQLREVGIDLVVEVHPTITTNEAARREDVHMSPMPSARSDPSVLGINHSDNQGTGLDFTYHTNDRLDDLLDAGVTATDEDERLEIYSEIQMLMMEDAMVLPVFRRDNVSAMHVGLVEGNLTFDRGFFPYVYDLSIRS